MCRTGYWQRWDWSHYMGGLAEDYCCEKCESLLLLLPLVGFSLFHMQYFM